MSVVRSSMDVGNSPSTPVSMLNETDEKCVSRFDSGDIGILPKEMDKIADYDMISDRHTPRPPKNRNFVRPSQCRSICLITLKS